MSEMYYPEQIYEPQVVNEMFLDKRKERVIKKCVIVGVSGDEYDLCESASKEFWCNSKPGAYGAGLGNTPDDECKTTRTGLLGEMAYGKLFGSPVDISRREYGDEQDHILGCRYKVDVKCPMRNYGKVLIKHTNEWGAHKPLNNDVYVCGYIHAEDRKNKKAKVVMTGFALKHEVEAADVQRGRKGKGHLNYELRHSDLRSITALISKGASLVDRLLVDIGIDQQV